MTIGKNLVTLCGATDRNSFFLPSLGFATADQATAHANLQVANVTGLDIYYAPFVSSRCAYVPRIDDGKWDVYSFLAGRTISPTGKPIWTKLASRDDLRPEGAYNVALLVEGRRQYFQHQRKTCKHPKWWYRLSEGQFDCYAAWGRNDTVDLPGGIVVDDATRVYAARSGRGAIYLRRALFDNKGEPDGFRCGLLLVQFSILDRDQTKDDMLKVQIVSSRAAITFNDENPWKEYPDDGWRALADKAHAGFEKTCKTVPDTVDHWRKYFIEQSGKWHMNLRHFNSAANFTDGVKGMPWEQALQVVQEPWQLKVVLGVHCNQRFDDSPHRSDTTCSRVWRMLSQFTCSDERRAELRQMIHDYVEPDDHIWNYSGD
jgi:hypothetical protein